jgi:hypothetical protein
MREEPEAKVEEGAEVKKEEPPTVWTKKSDMTIMEK